MIKFFLACLRHIVWPAHCPVCGRLAVRVCRECLESLTGPVVKFCVECGGDSPCALHPGGFFCWSVSIYRGVNREVVHAMKYANGRSIAAMMGREIARILPRPDADVLVPIPLHRTSGRDYNQAFLIARGVSEKWDIPADDCLAWRSVRESQARQKNPALRVLPHNAIMGARKLRGRRVFLVDDVCTTGNTLNAAKRALDEDGAETAGAVVWSRGLSQE